MSGILPAHTFSDADRVDIRRFCGYPAYGTGEVSFVERFTRIYVMMETRMSNITDTEATVVQTYLTSLRTLEAAIPAAGANLDTDQAAVWFHNKREVSDRMDLYRVWRLKLCEFFGVPAGPGLKAGSGVRLFV
jgi:hypothetical protein